MQPDLLRVLEHVPGKARVKMATLTVEDGSLVLVSPYHPGLVAQIKALPYTDRRWDKPRGAWVIDSAHAQNVKAWVEAYLGERLSIPAAAMPTQAEETRLLEVRYLGQTKDRPDGSRSAFGLVAGQWAAIFPENVLRVWFEAGEAFPDQQSSLYGVLAVKKTASADEVKTAYRRMAMQWHPDRCREPNAAEQFLRVQEAYQILSNEGARARYDAGLQLQATLAAADVPQVVPGYRAPLRCGWVLSRGVNKMGRFIVQEILAWEDITNWRGQVLVVSWPAGATEPVEQWA